MHSLLALVFTVAASAVIARPPGPVSTMASQEEVDLPPTRRYLREYLLPRLLWAHYLAYDENSPEAQAAQKLMPATEWLNQEIERLSQMEMPRRTIRTPSYIKRWPTPYNLRSHIQPYYVNQQWPSRNLVSAEAMLQRELELDRLNSETTPPSIEPIAAPLNEQDKKKMFALTPRDQGFFEPVEKGSSSVNTTSDAASEDADVRALHESRPELEPEPPRHTRQNPNLSRHHQKSLIAEDLDDLRRGFVPAQEVMASRDGSRMISMLDSSTGESPGNFYGVALLSAISAAAVLAVLGFAVGWYTLSKRAKAAADVDYPAYGVTGPTIDSSGDRKLAHSAHMYHYQHQKQQIIAMERSGMEERSGSVSDPDSEDENEEGDYTVYECPGFATTGDMEVKNPLFAEDPTPATPGKCELVKPQPKD